MNNLAVVSGASGGIGTAVADALEAHGYTVVRTFCNHRKPNHVYLDITCKASLQDMSLYLHNTHGRFCDTWINCTGKLQQKPWDKITPDDWHVMQQINLQSVFFSTQYVMKNMIGNGVKNGSIVLTSSIGGQTGGMLAVHYAAAKAGVISLTKSFARIGADKGIRVNCVAPGLTNTEMVEYKINSDAGKEKIKQIPLGRVGEPSEIAQAVVMLCENSYMTGQTISCNGGAYMP